jgi:hypothetical protein
MDFLLSEILHFLRLATAIPNSLSLRRCGEPLCTMVGQPDLDDRGRGFLMVLAGISKVLPYHAYSRSERILRQLQQAGKVLTVGP